MGMIYEQTVMINLLLPMEVSKAFWPSELGDNYWYYEDEQGKHYEEGTLST